MRTQHRDDAGNPIVLTHCPMAMLTPMHIELIKEVCIFLDTNIPPVMGGQDEQPMWFYEVLGAVKSYRHRCEELASKKHAPT